MIILIAETPLSVLDALWKYACCGRSNQSGSIAPEARKAFNSSSSIVGWGGFLEYRWYNKLGDFLIGLDYYTSLTNEDKWEYIPLHSKIVFARKGNHHCYLFSAFPWIYISLIIFLLDIFILNCYWKLKTVNNLFKCAYDYF